MKHLFTLLALIVALSATSYANISISNFTFNVQPTNVLRVDVSFTISPAARAYVQYFYLDGADTIWGYTNIAQPSGNHSFTVVGLLPQKNYSLRAATFDETGIHYGNWQTLTTAAKPQGVPNAATVSVPDVATTGGYLMTTSNRFGLNLTGEVATIYDRKGNVVWYQFLNAITPGGFDQCKFSYPAIGPRLLLTNCQEIVEMGFDGTIHHRAALQGADTNFFFHHEVLKKENGNYLAIAASQIELDFSDTGGSADSLVVAESILEVDTQGNIVWDWHTYEQLDTNNLVENTTGNIWAPIFPGAYSWLHANGLAIDLDGGILASFRKSSQVFKINPNNKNTLFIMGHQGTLAFPISQRFRAQHCISVTGGNRYMVFDNIGKDSLSRVAEYFVTSYDGSVSLRWEYVLPISLQSEFLGSAYKLPNSNTLISTGLSAEIIELDSARQNVVLQMNTGSDWHYRAYSIPTLYEAPPAIDFAVADTFCGPDYTAITLTATPAPGFFTGPGVSGNVFDPNVAGTGVHELVYNYGWHTKTVKVDVGCVGIASIDALQVNFSLYPNPTTGVVNFSYQLPQNHQAQWSIVDLTGKEVANGNLGTQNGAVAFTADLSHLGKGFYMAVLDVGGQRTHTRLVLQ